MNLPFDLPLTAVGLSVLVLAIFMVTARVKKSRTRGVLSYPYVAAEGLFTAHEQAFLRVLEEAAGAYRVYGKVRVADVIRVRRGVPKAEAGATFSRISQKHLDFVLCSPCEPASSAWLNSTTGRTGARTDRRGTGFSRRH